MRGRTMRAWVWIASAMIAVAASTASAQDGPRTVIATRVSRARSTPDGWVPEWALVGLVRGRDGTWLGCSELRGVASEGTFAGRVTTTAWPPGSVYDGVSDVGAPRFATCAIDGSPARASEGAVAIVGDSWGRFGPFPLGISREDLAEQLGLDVSVVPQQTDARSLIASGPYRLSMSHGRVAMVAAFLDQLPGLAVSGAPTVAPTSSFEETLRSLALRSSRALGNAGSLRPQLDRARAIEIAGEPVAIGSSFGALRVGGRVLVFAWSGLRASDLLVRVRSVLVRHSLDGTLAR